MIGFLKGLLILLLATLVFGAGGYYTYRFYIQPEIALEREKEGPPPPPIAIADPTVEEFEKCLKIEAAGDALASRRSYTEFLEAYPDSSKAEEARVRLGAIQVSLLFSPRPTPDKVVTVVKAGDVVNKLCNRLKTSPELLMEMNQLDNPALRVGQRLVSVPSEFTAILDRPHSKLIVLRAGRFFTQYPILRTQGNAQVGVPPKKGAQPLQGKVHDKMGWKNGQRMAPGEKGFRDAAHWIAFQPGGHTLFADPGSDDPAFPKPPSGYGLEPRALRELVALLRKNDAVTIR